MLNAGKLHWALQTMAVVLSHHMLISIPFMSVEPLEKFAEAVVALTPWARDLKVEHLLSPLHLVCVFKKINLSSSASTISLRAWSDFDLKSFLWRVLWDFNQVLHTSTDRLRLLANLYTGITS